MDNDIDLLLSKTADIPVVVFSSKDTNGLTALHKVTTVFIKNKLELS